MFTGLVEEIGNVLNSQRHSKGVRLEVGATQVLTDLRIGDSISVNGCCLTVVGLTPTSFSCDIVATTWEITCLCDLNTGDLVNLERAMSPLKRFGGHIVQGHIDGVGTVAQKEPQADNSTLIRIEVPEPMLRYVIQKGSVAVDGVSLTVASCNKESFSFAMIPHTASVTILGRKEVGKRVNVEVDLIAKYVEKLHG